MLEVATGGVLWKKVFFKFCKIHQWILYFEFSEIFKSSFFIEQLRTTVWNKNTGETIRQK